MSYEFYKVLHLLGLFLALSGLMGLISLRWNASEPQKKLRMTWLISHGVGLLIMFVSGFGLAARLGYREGLPTWIYYKIIIWVLVGAAIVLIKRLQKFSQLWFLLTLILFTLAAAIAINKPGL